MHFKESMDVAYSNAAATSYGRARILSASTENMQQATQAFQFFKNDKLKVWFKRVEQAEAVAQTLVTGELPQAPLPLLFS